MYFPLIFSAFSANFTMKGCRPKRSCATSVKSYKEPKANDFPVVDDSNSSRDKSKRSKKSEVDDEAYSSDGSDSHERRKSRSTRLGAVSTAVDEDSYWSVEKRKKKGAQPERSTRSCAGTVKNYKEESELENDDTDEKEASTHSDIDYAEEGNCSDDIDWSKHRGKRSAKTKKKEEERPPNADECYECDDGGDLLCCDTCTASYHLDCTWPRLNALPEGEWSCSRCTVEPLRDVPEAKLNVRTDPVYVDFVANKGRISMVRFRPIRLSHV